MKSVLFIITNYNSANGMCIQKVAEYFMAQEIQVTILTCENANVSNVGEAIHYYTIPSPWSTRLCEFKDRYNRRIVTQVINKIGRFISRTAIFLHYFSWPLYSPIFCIRLIHMTKKIVLQNKIDVVIPVYNSIDALIAGKYIKMQYKSIKLIPYFLDSLLGGQKPSFMKETVRVKKAIRWEKRVLAVADFAVMMKSAKRRYMEAISQLSYFGKLEFLDIPLLSKNDIITQCGREKIIFNEKDIVFLFCGSIPSNIRNPKWFMQIFTKLKNPNYKFYLYGTNYYNSELCSLAEKDSRIILNGTVSHEEACNMMKEADFLINIGNRLKYMVPSKIFEYMSCLKPIISTVCIEEDPVLPYLSLYPSALILDENTLDINQSIAQLEQFIEEQKSEESLNVDSMTTLLSKNNPLYYNTPSAFLELLRSRLEITCN